MKTHVIRPLLASKWVVDTKTQPPMLFSELLEAELPVELRDIIDNLLEMKQRMPEMGFAAKIKELDDYFNEAAHGRWRCSTYRYYSCSTSFRAFLRE